MHVLLRSAAPTNTVCRRPSTLGAASPESDVCVAPSGLRPALVRPPPPAAAARRLPGNSRTSACAIPGRGSARRAQLPWKPLRAHAQRGLGRRAERRASRWEEGSPSHLTVAPISLGRSVPSSTLPLARSPERSPASHAPLPSSRICAPVQQAVRASGHFRRRAAIRAASAVEALPWQGPGGGKAKGGRGDKPQPPRGGSRGSGEGGALAAGGLGHGARQASRAFSWPAGLRTCICIRSSPVLSTLETTATPWAASGMSPSR